MNSKTENLKTKIEKLEEEKSNSGNMTNEAWTTLYEVIKELKNEFNKNREEINQFKSQIR